MNTIQLNLLDNKTIAAYVNGYSYAYEGGYRIIAGEQNATRFEIVSVPQQYRDATFSIEAINAKKKLVAIKLEDKGFVLPAGMAVAGYGQLLISCVYMHKVDGKYIEENVLWLPLKIKVWNTRPDWDENSISVTQEVLDRLAQAEADINELQAKIADITLEGNYVSKDGDTMSGELIIERGANSPTLTLGTPSQKVSFTLTTEERDGASYGITLGSKQSGVALTYFDAPLLYESGERVYSPNNDPPFRLSIEGQVQDDKIREKDYILKEIK